MKQNDYYLDESDVNARQLERAHKKYRVKTKAGLKNTAPEEASFNFDFLKSKRVRSALIATLIVILFPVILLNVASDSTKEVRSAQIVDTKTNEEVDYSFEPYYPKAVENEEDTVFDIKYDAEKEVFIYTHDIDSARIVVTQQRVPVTEEGQVFDLLSIATALSSNGATEALETNKGVAYSLTSKNNESTAVFTINNERLFFISAEDEINDQSWVQYINDL